MSLSRGECLTILVAVAVPALLLAVTSRQVTKRLAPQTAAPRVLIETPPLPPPTAIDEACRLVPTQATPLELGCHVTRVAGGRWQVDVNVVNRGEDVATGHVWVVAHVRHPDGREDRIGSPVGPSYKARAWTSKTFDLDGGDGVLTGLEVYVANGSALAEFRNASH